MKNAKQNKANQMFQVYSDKQYLTVIILIRGTMIAKSIDHLIIRRKVAGFWQDVKSLFILFRNESDYSGKDFQWSDRLTHGRIYWRQEYSYDNGSYGRIIKIFKWYIRNEKSS